MFFLFICILYFILYILSIKGYISIFTYYYYTDQCFFCLPPPGFEETARYGWYMLKGLYGTKQGGVEMESLQFVGCSWFIGLIGLVSDSPRINLTENRLCVRSRSSPVSSRLHLDAPGVHSLAHIAGAPPGRGHDWTPESRPRLGFNIIIFDPNHPNPFKGMVMAFSERVHMSVHTAVALCASLDFLQNTQNSQNSGGFRVYGSTALNPKPVFEVLCLRLCR